MRAEEAPARRCGVIGSPIAHSLSPALHTAAYRELGLPWAYGAFDVTPEQLPAFLTRLGPRWRGLSVTMPLKRPIVSLCHEIDGWGTAVGAVNTVLLEPEGKRLGYNTDVPGLVAALREAGVESAGRLVVVGGGATAASALAAGAELGCSAATVLMRRRQPSHPLSELGERLGVQVSIRSLGEISAERPADVLISTIPATAQPAYVPSLVGLAQTVFDVVYDPWWTPLLRTAGQAGRRTVHGFELLLHQAGRQLELMTGVPAAPLAAMRAAGLAAVGQSA